LQQDLSFRIAELSLDLTVAVTMAMDYGLLAEDTVAGSKKSLKVVGCIVGGIAACAMVCSLVQNAATFETSGTALVAAGRLPFTARPVGGSALRGVMSTTMSSPMAKLAISALETNERINQRDISMHAVQNRVVSGWDLVDTKTKDKLLKTIDSVKFKASALAGVTAPMNYFDPLGFATTVSAGKFLFYREVELKHGRVAMLAALGILVGENFHPLFGGDIDVPAAFAFQQTPLETFWPAVVAAIAIPEIYSVFSFQDPTKGEQWAIREDHEPGNLGFDPLGLKPTDEKELVEMKSKELNNGRLAMIAAAGMIAQELVTGQKLF
jgi:hypothetical protein